MGSEKKCGRAACGEAEFRIDGFCSDYCRDLQESDDEHAEIVAALTRERDFWKGMAEKLAQAKP